MVAANYSVTIIRKPIPTKRVTGRIAEARLVDDAARRWGEETGRVTNLVNKRYNVLT